MKDENLKQTVEIDSKDKNDYLFILNHDILPVIDICLVARNICLSDFLEKMKYKFPIFCEIKSLIVSGIRCGKIKHASEFSASPLDSFMYLKEKGIMLPQNLTRMVDSFLESMQNNLEIKKSRSRDSYLDLEIRKFEPVLIAVLKTLLDLYPGYPKDKLMHLKPIQEYAKGNLRSPTAISDLITEIEGKNRAGGNKNKKKIQQIEEGILEQWKEKISS